MTRHAPAALTTLALGVALAAGPALAQLDGDVQWALLSHEPAADRRPLCPLAGQPFEVLFQTAPYDVTSARVRVDPGADGVGMAGFFDARWVGRRGPIDLWSATLPGWLRSRFSYTIEVTDGDDVDYLTPAGPAEEPIGGWVIDTDTLEHAPYGATPVTGGVVFRVWAPNAVFAAVRGSFNDWAADDRLTKLGEDFIGFIPGAAPGDAYKYFFDNTHWRTDPRGRYIESNGSVNARVIDPLAYRWNNDAFTPEPRENWVVYQLHIGTFAGLNDPYGPTPAVARYKDVTARVDHLRDLGVNAVMLNPINEFPTERSGGYNSTTMFAFESSYGTPDELKEMIDTLHGAGIAVLLDVVWNHFPSGDNILWEYDGGQPYFDDPPVGTPWGPQADIDNPNVLRYFFDSVETVLGEYRMDGYRHDAIYELVSASQWEPGQRLVRDSMARIRSRFPDAHVIGEVYNNSAWNTSPAGIDLDAQYHEAFKNAVKQAVDDAAFGDPDVGRLAAAIDGSGPWVEGPAVFNYYELHDEAWSLSGEGRTRAVKQIDTAWPHDDRYALGRTKLANGLTILSQGMPAILMGTEWAEDNGWEVEKIDWSHRQTYADVFDFYRDLIDLRTRRPALSAWAGCDVFHVNEGANVLAFERFDADGRSYVVVANFSNTDFPEYNMGVPRQGEWGLIVNSEDARYGGTGFGTQPGPLAVTDGWHSGHGQYVSLQLPAHGFVILQHEPEYVVEPTAADRNLDGSTDADDVRAFLADLADRSRQADVNGDIETDAADLFGFLNAID